MIPDPLHPAVVHFPIVLMVIQPILALGALFWIARGGDARRTWIIPLVFSAMLLGSAWLASETGQLDEERVEEVVTEQTMERHEEGGQRFVWLSAGALAVTAVGFGPGMAGIAGRVAGTAAGLLLMMAGWQVGHSGGELVYREGAATVHVESAASGEDRPSALTRLLSGEHDDDEDDEDDDHEDEEHGSRDDGISDDDAGGERGDDD